MLDFMMGPGIKTDLISHIANHDEYRNEKYAEVFPEFAQVLGIL